MSSTQIKAKLNRAKSILRDFSHYPGNVKFQDLCRKHCTVPFTLPLVKELLGLEQDLSSAAVTKIWDQSSDLQLAKMLFDKFVEMCGDLNEIDQNTDLISKLYLLFLRNGLIKGHYVNATDIGYMDRLISDTKPYIENMLAEVKAKSDTLLLDNPALQEFFEKQRSGFDLPHNQYSLGDFIVKAAAPRTSVEEQNRDDISHRFTDSLREYLSKSDQTILKKFIKLEAAAGYYAAAISQFVDIRLSLENATNPDEIESVKGLLVHLPQIMAILKSAADDEVSEGITDTFIETNIALFNCIDVLKTDATDITQTSIIDAVKSQYADMNQQNPERLERRLHKERQTLQEEKQHLEMKQRVAEQERQDAAERYRLAEAHSREEQRQRREEQQRRAPVPAPQPRREQQQAGYTFGLILRSIIAVILYPFIILANAILSVFHYFVPNKDKGIRVSGSAQPGGRSIYNEPSTINSIMQQLEKIHVKLTKEGENHTELNKIFARVKQSATKDLEPFCKVVEEYIDFVNQQRLRASPPLADEHNTLLPSYMQMSTVNSSNNELSAIREAVSTLRHKM